MIDSPSIKGRKKYDAHQYTLIQAKKWWEVASFSAVMLQNRPRAAAGLTHTHTLSKQISKPF